jgi:hypothetical protein
MATKEDPSIVHKGTIMQIPPKVEHTGMCVVTELNSKLYCEPCNLMGVSYNEIDFICDTGAVSGGMGLKVRKILFNT